MDDLGVDDGGTGDMDMDSAMDSAFNTLPPGEEGLFLSHAGSEEDILRDIIDGSARSKYVHSTKTKPNQTS